MNHLTNLLSREQIEAMRIIQTKGQVTINELAGLQNIFKTAASKESVNLKKWVMCKGHTQTIKELN